MGFYLKTLKTLGDAKVSNRVIYICVKSSMHRQCIHGRKDVDIARDDFMMICENNACFIFCWFDVLPV
jgi:hypothetical protein